jgi:hypothetical protein
LHFLEVNVDRMKQSPNLHRYWWLVFAALDAAPARRATERELHDWICERNEADADGGEAIVDRFLSRALTWMAFDDGVGNLPPLDVVGGGAGSGAATVYCVSRAAHAVLAELGTRQPGKKKRKKSASRQKRNTMMQPSDDERLVSWAEKVLEQAKAAHTRAGEVNALWPPSLSSSASSPHPASPHSSSQAAAEPADAAKAQRKQKAPPPEGAMVKRKKRKR